VNWIVSEEALKELDGEAADTVFAVGNGRFCTRGTRADAFACRRAPWPLPRDAAGRQFHAGRLRPRLADGRARLDRGER